MNLFSKLFKNAGAVTYTPTTARAAKHADGALELAPSNGTIRIFPILAAYMGINHVDVIASTDGVDKPQTHPGIYVTILGVKIQGIEVNIFTIAEKDSKDTASYKVAAPTNKLGSSMQFNAGGLWAKFGGDTKTNTTYNLPLVGAIVTLGDFIDEETGFANYVTFGELVENGQITHVVNKDDSFKSATWAANDYGFAIGSNVEMSFILDDNNKTVVAKTERAASVRKAKTEVVAPATNEINLD